MAYAAAIRWTDEQARTAREAVLELADQPGREATLARFEAARPVSGSTVVKVKPNQVELVTVALHMSKSPTAVSALRVLERDVIRAAAKAGKQERKEKAAPGASLSNLKASERPTRARHQTGRPRPGR
jgi:hypothetical protein